MTMHSVPFNGSTTAARCERCRRPLTDSKSIQLGMGPECRGRSMRGGGDLCRQDEFSDSFDNAIPFERALVMRRGLRPMAGICDEQRSGVITNVPHLVVHHSPNGYEFGYAGSGPAELALNVCQLYLNMTGYEGQITKCRDGKCWSLAFVLHQRFKDHFIATAPRTGRMIPFAEIDAWFKSIITSEMLEQFCKE